VTKTDHFDTLIKVVSKSKADTVSVKSYYLSEVVFRVVIHVAHRRRKPIGLQRWRAQLLQALLLLLLLHVQLLSLLHLLLLLLLLGLRVRWVHRLPRGCVLCGLQVPPAVLFTTTTQHGVVDVRHEIKLFQNDD